MANGYDLASEAAMKTQAKRAAESPADPAKPVREAAGNKRSDGKSSQDKDGANRYDTSTPEKRRKALAAARRSGNPDDLKKLRGKVAESALEPPQYPREAVSSGDIPNLDEAPLNAKKRNKLPVTAFAGPNRTYPIDTPARARSALARVKANGSPELQRRVIAAVKRRYPDMDMETTSGKKPTK
jgi:hypothetical protein